MLRLILAVPLIAHGLAHISGFIASWTNNDSGYGRSPWVFSSGIGLQSPVGRLFGILWLCAAFVLTVSGVGLTMDSAWWQLLAVTGSIISLVVILPWWNTVPSGAKLGALFDLLILILLLTPLGNTVLDFVAQP
jgi:hypothetical protein